MFLLYVIVSECSANLTNSTGPTGNITSPNYPDNYPDASLCELRFEAPPAHNVLLTIEDFIIEDSFTCDFDSFSVYDSNKADEDKLIGVYCGETIPDSFTSSGQDLLVIFQTDGSVNERGFQAQYRFVEGKT